MRLLEFNALMVPKEKLTEYLLSETHPVGKWKCRFFHALGYDADAWMLLAADLEQVARKGEVREAFRTAHGVKYVIDGVLRGPGGRTSPVRTIWVADLDRGSLRFVTAYPAATRQEWNHDS